MDWGLAYIGDELYGKVDVRLTEMMHRRKQNILKLGSAVKTAMVMLKKVIC
ncbi:MAG: hypothetical protein KIC77_08410 [Clostridiales bacterium]|nr:hypothetical protein [Clostridiales bacterium]